MQDQTRQKAKGKKRSMKGSSTVEAALVVPLLLGVIFFTVYAAVFLYNRAAAQSACGQAAVMAAGMEHENSATIESRIGAYLKEEGGHFPMVVGSRQEVKASLINVRVCSSLSQEVNAFFIPGGKRKLSFEAKETIQRLDPAAVLRMKKRAKKKGKKE